MLITIPFAFKVSEAIAGGVYYGILLSIPVFIWFILSGVDKHILNKVSYRFVGFITTILAVFTALQYWAYSFGGAQNLIIKFFDEHGGFMPVSFFTFEYGATSVIRPSSLMGDPNFLAVFLATLAIIGVDFIVKKFKEEKRVDWIMIGFLFLNLANIFVSGSRSGILVLIVEVVVYFSGNLLFKKQFFAVTAFGNLFARFKDALTLKDASTIQHLDFAKTAIEMFKQKPIFGVGIANYPYYFWEYFNSQAGFATPHSIYFQFLAETGLLGFIGLIGVIIYIAQNLIKNKNILYLSIFAGFLVGNITYGYFMTPWVWFYIGLFLL
jgi:O-antigen ligase